LPEKPLKLAPSYHPIRSKPKTNRSRFSRALRQLHITRCFVCCILCDWSEWVQCFRLYDTQFEFFHYLIASLGAIGYNETRMDYSAYEIDLDHILPTLLWGSLLRRGWKTVTFPVGRIRWATWVQAQGNQFDFAPALTSHSGVAQRVFEPLRREEEILRWSALSSRRSYHKANLCYSVFIQTFQATLYHVSLAKVKLNPGKRKTLSWWRENVKQKTGCSRFCNILYWIM